MPLHKSSSEDGSGGRWRHISLLLIKFISCNNRENSCVCFSSQANGTTRKRTNLFGKTSASPSTNRSHVRRPKVCLCSPSHGCCTVEGHSLFDLLWFVLVRRGHWLCGQWNHHERRRADPADDDGEREDDHRGRSSSSGRKLSWPLTSAGAASQYPHSPTSDLSPSAWISFLLCLSCIMFPPFSISLLKWLTLTNSHQTLHFNSVLTHTHTHTQWGIFGCDLLEFVLVYICDFHSNSLAPSVGVMHRCIVGVFSLMWWIFIWL